MDVPGLEHLGEDSLCLALLRRLCLELGILLHDILEESQLVINRLLLRLSLELFISDFLPGPPALRGDLHPILILIESRNKGY